MSTTVNDSLSTGTFMADLLSKDGTRYLVPIFELVLLLQSKSHVLGSSFGLLCIALSGLWLVARAYAVLRKPLDELVNHLGFDFPQAPRVDLAGIKADGLLLHWVPADERKSSNKFEVQVNGEVVDTIPAHETSFTVVNLKPDHDYVVRVAVVNTLDIRAASEAIRAHTKAASSGDFFHNGSPDGIQDGVQRELKPQLRSLKILPDANSIPLSAPSMSRETSNGPVSSKRTVFHRRPSPANIVNEAQVNPLDHVAMSTAVEDNQQQLTARLEGIGRDIQETERMILEEDQEAAVAKSQLAQERDDARTMLKERENTSKDLRKQVSTLERENTAAQAKRSTQERHLLQRKGDLQKIKDDIERWQVEARDMNVYAEKCEVARSELLREAEDEKQSLQEQINDEMQALRQLEDDVKEHSLQIKHFEQSNATTGPHNDDRHGWGLHNAQDAEEERAFHDNMQYRLSEYRNANADLEASKRFLHEVATQHEMWSERRRQMNMFPGPYSSSQTVSRHSSTGRRQISGDQNLSDSSGAMTYHPSSAHFIKNDTTTSGSPERFSTGQPSFFNVANGMSLDTNPDHLGVSSADVERLTGGAPMSPSAGASLLPAGLLSTADEEPPVRHLTAANDNALRSGPNEGILPGLGAFGSNNMLPGLGVSNMPTSDFVPQGPASPVSASSRSPSVFASPKASATNLAFHSPEPAIDADGRSIRSGRSIRPPSGGGQSSSRFAQILGFDKLKSQRNKALADDALSLGRVQSHSMPKDAGLEDPQSASSKRRNSSHGGNLFGSFKAGLGNGKAVEDSDPDAESSTAPQRKSFRGMGGRDGWNAILGRENRPGSPRQGSTHSTELPRPKEQRERWGLWGHNDAGNAQNPSQLGPDWSQAPTRRSRMWGGSSSQRAPNSSSSFIEEYDDDDEEAGVVQAPAQAPIGTKPAPPIERSVTPKLNPAAKDFKSLFMFGEGKKDKSEKGSKGKGKEANLSVTEANPVTPTSTNASPLLQAQDDLSPPPSRRSRDERSVTTAESSTNETHSRNSLDRTPSHQVFDAVTPTSSVAGSSNKGSFMRKLSRKGSSSKFSLPGFQRDKKARNAEKTVSEEVSGAEDGQPASSVDNMSKSIELDREERRYSSRNWSSMFSMTKGKDKAKETQGEREKTPSVSEASMTSASEVAGDARE